MLLGRSVFMAEGVPSSVQLVASWLGPSTIVDPEPEGAQSIDHGLPCDVGAVRGAEDVPNRLIVRFPDRGQQCIHRGQVLVLEGLAYVATKDVCANFGERDFLRI